MSLEEEGESPHFDVIVVGAGLSGLNCADAILSVAPHCSLAVLEANDRCGGRTKSCKQVKSNVIIDEGGMWVGKLHTSMLRLCDRFGVKLVEQQSNGRELWITRSGKRCVSQADGEICEVGFFAKYEITHRIIKHIDALCEEIPLVDPWTHPRAKEFDSYSLDGYFRRILWTEEALAFLNDVTRGLLGCESSQISFLFYLWSVKSSGGFDYCMSTRGGAQEFRMLGGAQQISEGLRKCIESHANAEIILNARVISAKKQSSGKYLVKTTRGQTFSCNEIICSANASLFIREVAFEPRLPAQLEQFAQRTFRGSYGKAIVTFKTAFWQERGYSGSILNSKDDAFVCSSMDYCLPKEYQFHALACFLSGDAGIRSASLGFPERRKGVLCDIAEAFNMTFDEISDQFLEYHETLWHMDPVAQGCSGIIFGPGHFMMFAPPRIFGENSFLDDSVHFIGTDVCKDFIGYMEGAVRSGRELGDRLGSKFCKYQGKEPSGP